ncbi:MAG TPA: carboxylating nicotinate-nucleotide diphosphorylase [Bacteroidota bacterium]|nr:carboxylating nicotinate-nucleotide diphosphorylase [Bacteroidota bacterium]
MISEGRISRIIEEALMEDLGLGDVTTDAIIDESEQGSGTLMAKSAGVVAGLEIAALVFHTVDSHLEFSPLAADGDAISAGKTLATVSGSLASILKAERTALNILQRMSGIATLTHAYVRAVSGTKATIIDTRKTAPGLRALDKLAVTMGGGTNHRFGLDDMVLIKDNHIAAAGSIGKAIQKCIVYLDAHGLDLKIEVETTTLKQVREALQYPRVNRIMLDNSSVEAMREAVAAIAGKVETEASGNVTLETVRRVAETGVDLISVGALTHSVKALDISLEVSPQSAA